MHKEHRGWPEHTDLAATGGDGAELLRDACRPFAARA